jgi:hypothetical protein
VGPGAAATPSLSCLQHCSDGLVQRFVCSLLVFRCRLFCVVWCSSIVPGSTRSWQLGALFRGRCHGMSEFERHGDYCCSHSLVGLSLSWHVDFSLVAMRCCCSSNARCLVGLRCWVVMAFLATVQLGAKVSPRIDMRCECLANRMFESRTNVYTSLATSSRWQCDFSFTSCLSDFRQCGADASCHVSATSSFNGCVFVVIVVVVVCVVVRMSCCSDDVDSRCLWLLVLLCVCCCSHVMS